MDDFDGKQSLDFNCNWCHKVFYCSQSCLEKDKAYHEEVCMGLDNLAHWQQICIPKQDAKLGLTGIRNINNSCYFSSSLQCLSHAIGLTNYFLHGSFKDELNQNNPLGTQGKLAIGYARLLKSLWMDNRDSIAPYQLKSIIGKFKRQFNNQEQQDSQELLSVLLDGLHEDLNRVKNKPLVPMLESDGSDDVCASKESWQNHLKRNQSIIVDLMHGQYKSTVQCPDCNKVSVTFEPFMNLTLPIPEMKMIQKQFFYVPFKTSERAIHHVFNIKSHKMFKHLSGQIAKQFGIKRKRLELVLVQDDRVLRILPRDELVSLLNQPKYSQTTILALETPKRKSMEVWVNFQVVENPKEPERFSTKFPRLTYLKLDDTLINAHLQIFDLIRPMFLKYLETRERLNEDPRDRKALKKRKGIYGIPPMLTSECWNQMNLTEQYTQVFGPQDPSRRKLEDLPFYIKIVSRQREGRCVFCRRELCTGCPLGFDDKKTLREFLDEVGVTTKPTFYHEEHYFMASNLKKPAKCKYKKTRGSFNRNSSQNEEYEMPFSPEFELTVQLNSRRCWALYSYLDRFQYFKDSKFVGSDDHDDQEQVSIHDCFRQFHKPENLSQANTWYCNKCYQHKQALKKIQLYNTPPILIINFKRFRGQHAKSNILVEFPVRELVLSDYLGHQVESQKPIYDLFAVSNHFGQLQAGHYTAIVRNGSKWFQFNDHKITQVPQESIVTSAAYILFYQRRGISFGTLDYRQIQNKLSFCAAKTMDGVQSKDVRKGEKNEGVSEQNDPDMEPFFIEETGGT